MSLIGLKIDISFVYDQSAGSSQEVNQLMRKNCKNTIAILSCLCEILRVAYHYWVSLIRISWAACLKYLVHKRHLFHTWHSLSKSLKDIEEHSTFAYQCRINIPHDCFANRVMVPGIMAVCTCSRETNPLNVKVCELNIDETWNVNLCGFKMFTNNAILRKSTARCESDRFREGSFSLSTNVEQTKSTGPWPSAYCNLSSFIAQWILPCTLFF